MKRSDILKFADIVAAHRAYSCSDEFNNDQEDRTVEAVFAALALAGFHRPSVERKVRALLVVGVQPNDEVP